MKKTSTRLADGREIIYYDLDATAAAAAAGTVRGTPDRRPLDAGGAALVRSEIRPDPLLGDTVAVASHRQARTYHPPAGECPLCPSDAGTSRAPGAGGGRLSEIPDSSYDVVVFENRFPSLSGDVGRCEVVCFTPDHDASFASLTEEQAALVLDAWTDRTAALGRLDAVTQVYCFENRGAEIGVTLGHPHGQIYGYPFVTPRTAQMLRSLAAHRARTGRNLFDDVLADEHSDGRRIVLDTAHWTAFVPYAAHWPYEVHLYPKQRVPDLCALPDAARAEFGSVYLDLLRRFDRLFDERAAERTAGQEWSPTPYISGWHQAPFDRPGALEEFGVARDDFALHLELFTIRRTSGKLKFLAGSESGMSVFINDVPPEAAAERLREVANCS